MILYNWPKIYSAANGKASVCLKIFKMMVEGTIPKNHYDDLYVFSTMDFSGESFLLHPDVFLFYSFKYEIKDLAIYLSMASIRPLAQYILDQTVHLPFALAPLNPLEHLKEPDSGLITIDSDMNIHFKYEETPSITH